MEELGKAFPAAEGMVDAEQNTKQGHVNENCLNCGTKLIDSFCHHCGQKDIPRRQTLGDMLSNFISSFWSYEGKFFLTTKFLITKPGFLAVEYNRGRRESYYHPARMYVFISFVFFLIFFSLPEDEKVEMNKEDVKELNKDFTEADLDSILSKIPADPSDSSLKIFTPSELDSIKKSVKKRKSNNDLNFNLSESKYKSVKSYDSAQNVLPEEKRDGWFRRRLTIRSIELSDRYKGDGNMKRFGNDFVDSFKDNFSKILFWLLPFFALLLKLLYVRRDFYYSEHLVLTIYYYNFFYLAASIQLLVGLVPWLEWMGDIITLWILLYLLLAMKRVYGQSWRKTIAKYMLFWFGFSFLILIAVSITAMAVLMMI